ncbi:MAG: hypothetical protein ABGW79_08650, partial [Pirellulales bacterium]
QFGNIKRFTFLLLMEERHPRLVRQGWRFFAYQTPFCKSKSPSFEDSPVIGTFGRNPRQDHQMIGLVARFMPIRSTLA